MRCSSKKNRRELSTLAKAKNSTFLTRRRCAPYAGCRRRYTEQWLILFRVTKREFSRIRIHIATQDDAQQRTGSGEVLTVLREMKTCRPFPFVRRKDLFPPLFR